MKVKYLKDVQSPPDSVGKTGEVRELDRDVANHLIKGGYVEDIENPAPKPQPKVVNRLIEEKDEKPESRSKK